MLRESGRKEGERERSVPNRRRGREREEFNN
jgi:hypothetical protein